MTAIFPKVKTASRARRALVKAKNAFKIVPVRPFSSSLAIVSLLLAACAGMPQQEALREAEGLREIAEGLLEDGRPADALARFQEALAKAPSEVSIKFDIGRAYHALSRPAEAARWTREACEGTRPEVPGCWNNLALFEFEKGDPAAAEKAARRALSFDTFSEPEKAYATLARALAAQKRLDEADAAAQKSVERNPEDCLVRCVRTHVLVLRKDYEEALFQARWAARKCPFDPRSLAWEGYARYQIGQHRVAKQRFTGIVERFSGSQYAEYSQRALDALSLRRPVEEPPL